MSADGKARELEAVARSVDSTRVLAITGEIDMASAPRFQAAVDEALREQPAALVIDLSEVEFFGSAGLSVLLVAAESVPQGQLRVVASPPVRRPIEVTGLDKLLSVFNTVDDALAA
ncbi:anti-sigma factor antagonist [Nocardia brasiliensis]|uniref:Anti-sigma factor antagonist n=1 Tax=Nocardia brasiliensis TaxID=37326 RepID=A0A6G9XQK9_NOCBR|nr:STAS domain-containing protein [Nocardia brasiliensis]QIS03113.1 anti-sigma factor antagonist [Nocardia brasiliensis]